jgi:HEAT repeat protein
MAQMAANGSRHHAFLATRESRLVALMFALAFLIVGLPRVFTASAAETLFIKTYGAQSLPYIYIVSAAVIPLFGMLYMRLQARLPYSVLLVASLVFDGIALIALRLGALTGAPIVSGIIAVWFEMEWVLTSMALWGLANQLFDVRQSKRVFGLIGAGELVATITGGFLTPAIVGVIGTGGLLLCSATGVFCGSALILFITRAFAPNLNEVAPEEAGGTEAKKAVGKDRSYVNLIFGLALFSLLAYYFVDNAFYATAQLRFPNEDALAGFIGVFFGIAGIAGLFCRLVLSRWMFAKFGVKSGLLLLPILFFVCSGAIVFGGLAGAVTILFWLTTANKLFDTMGRSSLYENAVLTLYQALPPQRRVWAQTIVESLIEPLSGGIAGVAMILLNKFFGFSVIQLALAIIPLALGWAFVSWKLKDGYLATLSAALERRRLVGDSIVIDDDAGLEQIKNIIASDRAEDIMYAATLLERSKHPYLSTAVSTLLSRREPLLRMEAARIIMENEMTDCIEAVREQLEREADPVVKGALVKALAAISDEDAIDSLSPYLQAEEPVVRRDAIVGLVIHGGIEGVIVAGEDFMSALRSTDPVERKLAAQVIGELRNPQFYRSLLLLLEDPNMAVREAALAAAAYVDAQRVQRLVIRNLQVPAVTRRATSALVTMGDRAIPALEFAFDVAQDDLDQRLRIVAIFGQIRTQQAHDALEARLELPGEILRHTILQALKRGRYVAPPAKHALYRDMLVEEAAEAAWTLATADDLGESPDYELLVHALSNKIVRHQERIFALLSFLHPGNAVRDAYGHYVRGPAEKRAYALEVLDNLLATGVRDLLFPVLDEGPYAKRRKLLENRFPQEGMTAEGRLRDVAVRDHRGASPWLHACALYTIGALRIRTLQDALPDAAAAHDPLIAETARWAFTCFDPSLPNEDLLMSTTIEKVIVLRTVDIFRSLPEEYLVDIAGRVEEVDVSAGEKIITAGELGSALFIIVDGKVRVHHGEMTLASLGMREIFGELTALDPEPRSADVTAVEDSRMYKLEYQDLDDIMSSDVEVSRNIIKMLCRRLRASTARDHVTEPAR